MRRRFMEDWEEERKGGKGRRRGSNRLRMEERAITREEDSSTARSRGQCRDTMMSLSRPMSMLSIISSRRRRGTMPIRMRVSSSMRRNRVRIGIPRIAVKWWMLGVGAEGGAGSPSLGRGRGDGREEIVHRTRD